MLSPHAPVASSTAGAPRSCADQSEVRRSRRAQRGSRGAAVVDGDAPGPAGSALGTRAAPAKLTSRQQQWCTAVQLLLQQLKSGERLDAEQLRSWKEQQQWLVEQNAAFDAGCAAASPVAAPTRRLSEPEVLQPCKEAVPAAEAAAPVSLLPALDLAAPGSSDVITAAHAAAAEDWWIDSLLVC